MSREEKMVEMLREQTTLGKYLAAKAGRPIRQGRVVATVFDEIPGHPELKDEIPGEILFGPLPCGDKLTYCVKLDRPYRLFETKTGPEAIFVEDEKLRPALRDENDDA